MEDPKCAKFQLKAVDSSHAKLCREREELAVAWSRTDGKKPVLARPQSSTNKPTHASCLADGDEPISAESGINTKRPERDLLKTDEASPTCMNDCIEHEKPGCKKSKTDEEDPTLPMPNINMEKFKRAKL